LRQPRELSSNTEKGKLNKLCELGVSAVKINSERSV